MHQCCEQCFLQKNIREYINNRRRIGNCCYCGRKNVAIAQTREVGIFIRESLDKEYEVLGEDTGSMYDSEDDMYIDRYGEEAGMSTEAEDGTMLTASEECNVRAEASTDADILGVISAGDQVQKTGTDGEWVQIDYDGQTGYIRGDLLE